MSSPIRPTGGSETDTRGGAIGTRRPVQLVAAVFGVVFLLVGILGFVPGVTTDILAVVMIGLGVFLGRGVARHRATTV